MLLMNYKPSKDMNDKYYNTMYSHSEIDLRDIPFEEALNMPLYLFTLSEIKCEIDELDRIEIFRRSEGTNPKNQYYYSLEHTCYSLVILELLMANDLFPSKVWNIVYNDEHSFCINNDNEIFDLLIVPNDMYEEPYKIKNEIDAVNELHTLCRLPEVDSEIVNYYRKLAGYPDI